MAWGQFCWIPCPYKKWNEDDRPAVPAMLPLVGIFIGLIVGLAWWGLIALGISKVLCGAMITGLYFMLTGFIHLDGYMDCCDAVLPRHPDMERRREILKDPHTGAFGAIGLALMLVLFTASTIELSGRHPLELVVISVIVFSVSRAAAAVDVLTSAPMGTSQYAEIRKKNAKLASWIPLIVTVLVIAAGIIVLKAAGGKGLHGSIDIILLPTIITLFVAQLAGRVDRRALGGMNGDIAGHMIVTAEMFGMLATAVIA